MNGGDPGTFAAEGGAFSGMYSPTDLEGDGTANDPGWIQLGKFEDKAPKGDPALWKFSPSSIDGDTAIVLASFFRLEFATDVDGKLIGYKGNWFFTPDAEVAKRAEDKLGKNYFDMFMLVFKSGDAWAAYNITGAQFGITDPSSDDPVYHFSGTWDMSNTLQNCNTDGQDEMKCNPADLSHLTIYARDPGGDNDVPEPATLLLVGFALAGLSSIKRIRRAS